MWCEIHGGWCLIIGGVWCQKRDQMSISSTTRIYLLTCKENEIHNRDMAGEIDSDSFINNIVIKLLDHVMKMFESMIKVCPEIQGCV